MSKHGFQIQWKKIKGSLDTIQAILSIGAIVAASWWFLFSQQAAGKANCTQKLRIVRVTNSQTNVFWCSLELKIENVGLRALKLTNARIFAQKITPVPQKFKLAFDANGEVQWPTIFDHGRRNYDLDVYLMPGETDYENFEFVMPTNVECIKVYAYISRKRNDSYGWTKTTIYKIADDQAIELPLKGE
jgi:hypothetical protein